MASVKKVTTKPIRVRDSTHERLKIMAAKQGVPMSGLAVEAIEFFLARCEQ
jgi:predicted DNA-binding protein